MDGTARTWAARREDPDTAAVAELWADPGSPVALLADCPERVLEYLADGPGAHPVRSRVLANPRVPALVLSKLLGRLPAHKRRSVIAELRGQPPASWVRLAEAFTPASLARATASLQRAAHEESFGGHPDRAERDRVALAGVLRAFSTNRSARVRALVAEAFTVRATPRHRYSEGTVSALRLVADPEPVVRRGLIASDASKSGWAAS